MSAPRIDAHQHFWTRARGDYRWLTPALPALWHDFGPDDLAPHLARHGIVGTVLVQAADTDAETSHLLDLASRHTSVLGVVGWTALEAADAPARIAGLGTMRGLRGLRPMLQDLADVAWIRRTDVGRGLAAMVRAGLVLDALVRPQHLEALAHVIRVHHDLDVVIDHAAKPDFLRRNPAAGLLHTWKAGLAECARSPRVTCKLSGLLTEIDGDPSPDRLRPVLHTLLDLFGPERLMFGSDWPVLQISSSYDAWIEMTHTLIADLSPHEQDDILGKTAARVYHLLPPHSP